VCNDTAKGVSKPPSKRVPATTAGFVILDLFFHTEYTSGANNAVVIHKVLGNPIFLVLCFIDIVTFQLNKYFDLRLTIFVGVVLQ